MRLFIIHCLVCLICLTARTQSSSAIGDLEREEIRKQVHTSLWDVDVDVYLQEVPPRFRNTGAVVLQRTQNKEFYRTSRNYLRTVNLEHRVIKIQDQNGLHAFSLFAYESMDSEYAFDLTALRVIKPDGSIRVYDPNDLSIEKAYSSVTYREFIIPDLQVGDIIDYYYFLDFRVLFPQQYSRIFEPVYWLAQEEYPVLSADFQFVLGPSAFINASSTALPDFKQVNYKVDRKTFSRFSLHLSNLHALPEDMPWHYPFRSNPNVKYQVFITPYSGNSDIRFNLGGSLKLNSDILLSRLQDFMAYSLQPVKDDKSYFKSFKQYVKARGFRLKEITDREIVEQWQEYLFQRYHLGAITDKTLFRDNWQFVTITSGLLKQLRIDHEIVIGLDRATSTAETFVLSDEIIPFIRFLGSDTIYVEPPSLRIQPLQVAARLEDQPLYAYNPTTRKLAEMEMPGSGVELNWQQVHFVIKPDVQTGSLDVTHWRKAGGHDISELREAWLTSSILLDRFNTTDGGEWLGHMVRKMKQMRKVNQLIQDRAAQDHQMLSAQRVSAIERKSDSEVEAYKSTIGVGFDIESGLPTGIQLQESYSLLSDKYQSRPLLIIDLTDLHNIAWSNMPLATERSEDIYFKHPFKREVTFSIRIPDGYSAPDLSVIHTEESYAFGKLQVSTSVEDQFLLITMTYKILDQEIGSGQYPSIRSMQGMIDQVLNYKLLLRKMED